MRHVEMLRQHKKSLMGQYTQSLGGAILYRRTQIAEMARRIEVEKSSQIKDQFIANMSHELRTPLNAIMGFSKILGDIERLDLGNDKVAEYSHVIHQTAEQLLLIINEILDISKIQSGKFEIISQQVILSEVINSCLDLIKIVAEEKEITITKKIDPNLLPVDGCPTKLKQIFTNILSNAVKFTSPKGLITISAEPKGPDRVLIGVTDTGEGMDEHEIALALTPFCQVSSELSRPHEGTGLGLPIAKAFTELHEGTFHISSVKGSGTTINIELNVYRTERHVAGDPMDIESQPKTRKSAGI